MAGDRTGKIYKVSLSVDSSELRARKSIDLLHECFFEGVNRFLAKPENDSRRRFNVQQHRLKSNQSHV